MITHVIFLSGPIGSGKTTFGRALADRLAGSFIDGDDLSDPDLPWYCSILRTSRSIVDHTAAIAETGAIVVIAYPLRCINWIYFRRRFAEIGVTPLFISLRASYAAITDEQRGRIFSPQEHDRIRVMIAQGYGDRAFSDQVIDTDKASFQTTLAVLENKVRSLIKP